MKPKQRRIRYRFLAACAAALLTAHHTTADESVPRVVIDEDFADGAFDETGAGANGANWHVSEDEGIAFRQPVNRAFPMAFSRVPAEGKTAWAGAWWAQWDDRDGNGVRNDGEMSRFLVHKRNDVSVLRFRAFSDMAGKSPEIYGVEVALMEWWDAFCDDFHQCHDVQWEGRQIFHVSRAHGPLQLSPNVENIENRAPYGVKYAHYETNDGYPTSADLDKEYDNLVIWRNMPDRRATNVEQWGAVNHADYYIDTLMNSTHDPDNPFTAFDHVQITLFRELNTGTPFLLRDGVSAAEGQIGIVNLHVGVTRKADFNVDYSVDTADAAILVRNLGATGADAHLLSGDADNDDTVSVRDANALVAFWSEPSQAPISASGTYDPVTGRVAVTAEGVSYVAVIGPAGSLVPGALATSTLAPSAHEQDTERVAFFTTGEWSFAAHSLGAIAMPGRQAGEFTLVVNGKGSGNPDGFAVELGAGTVRAAFPHPFTAPRRRAVPAPLRLPSPGTRVTVTDLRGRRTVFRQEGPGRPDRVAGVRVLAATRTDGTGLVCGMLPPAP